MRVEGAPNFVSSGSKIVERLQRRKYDPVIIEWTIGLVLSTSTALYKTFLKRCTDKQGGLYDGTCPNLLRGEALITPPHSIVTLLLQPLDPSSLKVKAEHSLLWLTRYCWYIIFITLDVCAPIYDLSAWAGCCYSISTRRNIYTFLNVHLIARLFFEVGRLGP